MIGWMPAAGQLLGEFERPEQIVGVGERERRLAVGLGEFGQAADRQRPFQQRIGRVDVEMNESGVGSHSGPVVGRSVR